MFGTAAAMSFAFTAALIKVVSDYAARDWINLITHWQTYALIVFGVTGLFLAQNAFHAGPLAASQSTLVLVDPLFSIVIGIALFGDSLRTSEPWGPLEAISLLVMFIGAVFLSHSPLVTGLKGESKGAEYEELLSRRARHFGHTSGDAAVSA
jgi:surface polysaccharide O-acyltransferase-like enzyme